MLQFPISLFDLSNAFVGGGSLVACAIVCLLQYFHGMIRQRRFVEQTERFRQETAGLETELKSVNRDQALTKFENQILREILDQSEAGKALDHLMRRFVPNTNDGFAAFVELGQTSSGPRQSRGLSEESCRRLCLDESLIDSLRRDGALALEHLALQRSRFFASLAPADRRKIRQVYLIGVGDGADLFGVVVTTSLLPMGAVHEQQLNLTTRLLASIAGNLRQTLMLETQSHQLRCTREMLELRSITDGKFDQPGKMLEKFIGRLAQIVSAERGALYLSSREPGVGPKPMVRCGAPLPPGVATAWQQHEDRLAESGAVFPQPTYFDSGRLQKMQVETLVNSAVTLPLLQNGSSLGLLCLTRRTSAEFNNFEKQLLAWAADTLAQAMQRSLSYVAIERQARQDGLTELANRRTFDMQIQREIEQIQLGGQFECSLLLMDLDRFKSINDVHGHQAGDEVLRMTADILRDQMSRIRAGDRALLARYGGEELAALLPGIGVDGALRIAESIRIAVERQEIAVNGQTIRATISIGVATAPMHARTTAELIAAADLSLYQAKASGRNQACCANTPAGLQAHPVG